MEAERCSYHQLGQQQEGATCRSFSTEQCYSFCQGNCRGRSLMCLDFMGSQAEERGDGTGTWPLLRDQHNLQQDQETPHLSCCCCCFFWGASLTPQAELALGLGVFSPLQLSTSSLPFPPPQEFRPSNSSLNHPPHHQCHHFEMLPDATGASAQREKWPFKGKLLHLLGRVLLHSFKKVPHNYFMRSSL